MSTTITSPLDAAATVIHSLASQARAGTLDFAAAEASIDAALAPLDGATRRQLVVSLMGKAAARASSPTMVVLAYLATMAKRAAKLRSQGRDPLTGSLLSMQS